MPVTPDDLLDAARTSLDGSTGEVEWRNAASRAYYAAYHRCRVVAAEEKLPLLRTGSVHAALVGELGASRQRSLRALGYMLNQCRHLRATADYEIDERFERADAATVVGASERILARSAGVGA